MSEQRELPNALVTPIPKSIADTSPILGAEDPGATARSAPRGLPTEPLGAKPKVRPAAGSWGEVMSGGTVDARSGPSVGATGGNTERRPRLEVADPSALQ